MSAADPSGQTVAGTRIRVDKGTRPGHRHCRFSPGACLSLWAVRNWHLESVTMNKLRHWSSLLAVTIGFTLASPAIAQDRIAARPDNRWNTASDNEFFVIAYNVENLFDVDGVALFEDYKPDKYNAGMLLRKLQAITTTLSQFQNGQGPEIVLFQELEADQTPGTAPFDYAKFLEAYAGKTVDAMLQEPLADEVRDLPSEALLLKALADAGLGRYEVAVGEYRPDPLGRTVAHVNVTFSRFPIIDTQTHHSPGARGTLETVHAIGASKLHTLNLHWKSGASNAESELIRVGNAEVVRQRLDQILAADANADVILGGDFNSYYNQSLRFESMPRTALNDVLGSQGNELALQKEHGDRDLYNLWYELPPNERGSDTYQGYWGTLMQMILTPGLYDYHGIQFVDNSFAVAMMENHNAQPGSRAPLPWRTVAGIGGGVSDHLPITARFRIVRENDRQRYLTLENASSENRSQDAIRLPVDYSQISADLVKHVEEIGNDQTLQDPMHIGHVFKVQATVSGERPLRVKVSDKVSDDEFKVWSFDRELRMEIYRRFPLGAKVTFLGELDFHQDMWQFIIRDPAWLAPK